MTTEELGILITASTQQLVSGMGQAVGSVERLEKSIKGADTTNQKFDKSIKGMGGSLLGFAARLAAAAGAGMLFVKGLQAAAGKEQGEVQFATLLGGAEAAKERMAELAKFANETPFSNEEVIKMSKTLQAMTGGALASGEGLRLVGDTVAALNPQEMERFTMHIGRMYSQIKNGAAFGESMKELTELGAVSGDVAMKLKKMQDSGANPAEIWKVFKAELEKNKGAMEALSRTAGGAFSTLAGTASDAMADVFRPLTDALVPVMVNLTAWIEKMRPVLIGMMEEAVVKIQQFSGFLMSAFGSGDLSSIVWTSLQLGGMLFVNWFFGALKGVVDAAMAGAVGVFTTLASGDFWMGLLELFGSLGGIITGVVSILAGGMIGAVQSWYGFLVGGIMTGVGILKDGMVAAGAILAMKILDALMTAGEFAAKLKVPGAAALVVGMGEVKKGFEAVAEGAVSDLNNIPATFVENRAKATQFFDDVGQALTDSGKSMIGEAVAIGKDGFGKVGEAAGPAFTDAFAGFEVKPETVFDTTEMEGKLGDLVGRHWPAASDDAEKKVKDSSKQTQTAIEESVKPDVVADELAKIGGGGNVFTGAIAKAAGASGLSSGALSASSSGLAPGGAVGGSQEVGILQSIDAKVAQIISLMSGNGGGGKLTVQTI